jgi:hypothetical protein
MSIAHPRERTAMLLRDFMNRVDPAKPAQKTLRQSGSASLVQEPRLRHRDVRERPGQIALASGDHGGFAAGSALLGLGYHFEALDQAGEP